MNRWDALIRSAIATRQILVLRYEGWSAERTVELHTYGRDAKGEDKVSAWQEFGGSNSGEHTDWKIFKVSKIISLRAEGGVFKSPRADYKRGDSRFQTIYAEL